MSLFAGTKSQLLLPIQGSRWQLLFTDIINVSFFKLCECI